MQPAGYPAGFFTEVRMFFLRRLGLFWFLAAFFGFSGYFAMYNLDRVSISVPPWLEHMSVPAYLAFIFFFLLGSAVTWVYFGIEYTKKSMEVRRLTKKLRLIDGKKDQSSDRDAVPVGNIPNVR
jgi:hypothetical protein